MSNPRSFGCSIHGVGCSIHGDTRAAVRDSIRLDEDAFTIGMFQEGEGGGEIFHTLLESVMPP